MPLTARQKQVLEIIESFIDKKGYPPSHREIAEKLGVSGTLGVQKHLKALEREGCITRRSGSSRGALPVKKKTTKSGNMRSVPIVGTVRAGTPDMPVEDIEGYFSIDESQIKGDDNFFLRVSGYSMIEAHISPGDLALIKPQHVADNGDIVIAMINGEATMKRFFMDSGAVRLQPENRQLLPIIIRHGSDEVSIVGKVIGIYRPLS